MSNGTVIDDEGLPLGDAGPWVHDKHALLRRYVDISSAVRAKFTGPDKAGATYIDLYCGPGRLRERKSKHLVDGSAIVAALAGEESGHPFTEFHIADIDPAAVSAAAARLRARGIEKPIYEYVGPATAGEVVSRLNRGGLHVIFLDPYNLGDLPPAVLAPFAKLARADILVHVSAMDLQRNLEHAIDAEEEHQFDTFAPGWRDVVNVAEAPHAVRRSIRRHWINLIRAFGFKLVEEDFSLIRGTKNQPLYWLAFAAKHKRASEFWRKIRDIDPTRSLPLS